MFTLILPAIIAFLGPAAIIGILLSNNPSSDKAIQIVVLGAAVLVLGGIAWGIFTGKRGGWTAFTFVLGLMVFAALGIILSAPPVQSRGMGSMLAGVFVVSTIAFVIFALRTREFVTWRTVVIIYAAISLMVAIGVTIIGSIPAGGFVLLVATAIVFAYSVSVRRWFRIKLIGQNTWID